MCFKIVIALRCDKCDNEYGGEIVIKQDTNGKGGNDTSVTEVIRNEQAMVCVSKTAQITSH